MSFLKKNNSSLIFYSKDDIKKRNQISNILNIYKRKLINLKITRNDNIKNKFPLLKKNKSYLLENTKQNNNNIHISKYINIQK